MGAPQIIWLLLVTIGLTVSMFMHNVEVRVSFPLYLLKVIAMAILLYWGEFFS